MKLATLKHKGAVAVVDDKAVPLIKLGFDGSLLNLVMAEDKALSNIRQALKDAPEGDAFDPEMLDAPISHPSKIVAIGLNYMEHATESDMDIPDEPLVFTKFTSSITGPNDPIEIPAKLTEEVDYEVELGIIIGKKAKNISKEEALDHVFGYTVINDISARDLQFKDGQWVRGKSLDTFCPMGPAIVTADEVADPQAFDIRCSVNGETLQEANTEDMIFGVAELVSTLSNYFTLNAGDVIASGTPQGVGFSRKPPVFLKDGDTVKTWISGIGELNNPVQEV